MQAISVPGLTVSAAVAQTIPTNVLCLMNMVTPEELADNDEYEGMRRIVPVVIFYFNKHISYTSVL